jgi:hypothetical protein
MKTRAQLVSRALQKLGVIGAGQSPSAEDSTIVDDEIVPVMSDLSARGIYAWGDPDEIDDEAFVHIADILSNSVAQDFGKPQDEAKQLMAEKRLRALQPVSLSGQNQITEYF